MYRFTVERKVYVYYKLNYWHDLSKGRQNKRTNGR